MSSKKLQVNYIKTHEIFQGAFISKIILMRINEGKKEKYKN